MKTGIVSAFRRFAWNNRFCIGYVALSSFFLVLIVVVQSYRHDIFGTKLLLGWDSPMYVWQAQEVIKNGPLYMMTQWYFPYLYTQLLSFLGYLSGNVIMVERVLPLFFSIVLIYANYQVTLKISKNTHIAGLAALLTGVSINALRLLADLHRNLMALSLSTALFLSVPTLENRRWFFNKKFLLFILVLLIIASTHFETYFVLALSLVLYGFLTVDLKGALMLILACLIPVATLMLLFPTFFLGYVTTVGEISLESVLTFDEVFLWIGGSWIVFGFLIIGAFYSFRETAQRSNKFATLVFSNFSAIVSLALLFGLAGVLSVDFAVRALLLLPIPVLLALAVPTLTEALRNVSIYAKVFSAKWKHVVRINIRRLSLLVTLLALLTSSLIVTVQNANVFLTPYIPRSNHEKILMASEFLTANHLSRPVVIYYGEPAIWFIGLCREYLGMELGEHFTYYGTIENLFRFVPSEPKFKDNPSLMKMEEFAARFYYAELSGNWSGPTPFTLDHPSYITSPEMVMSHPILIIAPEFYNDEIPYYVRPFHVGEGIYIIPPNSLIRIGEAFYGPSILVHRDGMTDWVRSEYLYADPVDPSLIVLRVNGSSGYDSYTFTEIPPDWAFIKIEQRGDLSFPENDPKRLNGLHAINGNDPADSTENWSTSQVGTIGNDNSSRKEGFASLEVVGITDSWGNLGARYNPEGTWDLSNLPLLEVWAKANERSTFSINLVDATNGSRMFWAIQEYGSSVTTEWKRFVIDLSNYTSQTPSFDVSSVDHVDLFVSSAPEREMSLWIDDLIVDDFPVLNEAIYKARVLVEDPVHVYFGLIEMQ